MGVFKIRQPWKISANVVKKDRCISAFVCNKIDAFELRQARKIPAFLGRKMGIFQIRQPREISVLGWMANTLNVRNQLECLPLADLSSLALMFTSIP
jgi:hypothetical protein